MKNPDKSKTNLHEGHRDRVRYRLERDIEMEAFNEHEMLEYLLFHAVPRKDTNELAHMLINTFGSLGNVFNASLGDLAAVNGMTRNAALLIKSVLPISRSVAISRQKGRAFLFNSKDAIDKMAGYFQNEPRERVYVACLDISNRVLDVVNIGKGTSANTAIDLPKMMQTVTATAANKVILMHNHPSGNVYPSDMDIRTTNTAMMMLYTYNASLLDHIIFAPNGDYFSFFQNQIIDALMHTCASALSADIAQLYSSDNNIINYYGKSVQLQENSRRIYIEQIEELFGYGGDKLKEILNKINQNGNT